jgi:hypothetical protein
MLVESFEIQETAAEPIEACEEANRLIEELELDGQKTLLVPETPQAARMPYPEATAEQIFVFRVLCPQMYKLKEYRRAPIPLRVLQIAAHAQSLKFFRELLVWDAVTEKDPVLVGAKTDPQWTWRDNYYLLARWGEELESWPTLVKRAITRKRQQITEAVEAAVTRAKAFLPESMTTAELIEKGFDWVPTF